MGNRCTFMLAVAALLTAGPGSGAGPQTAGEWLAWVRGEAAKEREAIEADPVLRDIYRGSPVAQTGSPGTSGTFPPAAYESFMSGEGNDLIARLFAGTLPADQMKYRPLLQAHILYQAVKVIPKKKGGTLLPEEERYIKYASEVRTRGAAALTQAYKSGILDAAAMDDIRSYMLLTAEIDWVGSKYMPFKLGLMPRMYGPEPGDTAPDFCLPRADPVWHRPDFNPRPVTDPYRALTWAIAEEVLMVIAGHEPGPDGYLVPRKETLELPDGAKPEDCVRLSSFRGKKPVLLILGDATDTYCCHGIVLSKIEDIYRVFKDKVEFFWINDTVHDYRMPFMNYYADSPFRVREGAMHPLNMETRATTAQSFYMAYPYASIPCLLDNMAQTVRNSFSDLGGEAEFWLMDVNGVIAYRTKGPNECAGWGDWDKLNAGHLIRADCLTRALLALLKNGGVYDPSWPKRCDHIKITDPPWAHVANHKAGTVWFSATVQSVDAASGRITVTRDPVIRDEYPGLTWWQSAPKANAGNAPQPLSVMEEWTSSGAAREMKLKTVEGSYVALNGTACTLADFKPGDRMGVQIMAADAKNSEVSAMVLRAFRVQ